VRFLANENFPGDGIAALRHDGHDVAWVRSDTPGAADVEVLAQAVRENRILLTFDKDFGELAWRERVPATAGIVLFRMPMPPPAHAGTALAAMIAARIDWAGHFSVVEAGRVRMRRLPT
jgi:hypothetical protein